MGFILQSLPRTVIAGFILAIFLYLYNIGFGSVDQIVLDQSYLAFMFRWIHVLSGIMWIGLLWYFNFVQIPNMPNIPDDQKPAIGKVIAPAALFWFRWAAKATILSGLILGYINGYLHEAMTFQDGFQIIGIGMWLGTIMWFNVWFVIWPSQKKALGIIEVDPETKANAARTAMLFSRTNTLLSIPMLFSMVAAQNYMFR